MSKTCPLHLSGTCPTSSLWAALPVPRIHTESPTDVYFDWLFRRVSHSKSSFARTTSWKTTPLMSALYFWQSNAYAARSVDSKYLESCVDNTMPPQSLRRTSSTRNRWIKNKPENKMAAPMSFVHRTQNHLRYHFAIFPKNESCEQRWLRSAMLIRSFKKALNARYHSKTSMMLFYARA